MYVFQATIYILQSAHEKWKSVIFTDNLQWCIQVFILYSIAQMQIAWGRAHICLGEKEHVKYERLL